MTRRTKSIPFNPEKSYCADSENHLKQVESLNRIFLTVNEEGCSAETLEALKDDIGRLASAYGIAPRSVVLLAAIVERSDSNCGIDKEDLARYLGCSSIEFIGCSANLNELQKKGLVRSTNGPHKTYRVTPEAYKALETDSEFVPPKTVDLTPAELFSCFRTCFSRYRSGSLDDDDLSDELESLVRNNDHLSFCRKALESPLYKKCDETERRIFYYMCHRYVSHGETSVDIETLAHFADGMTVSMSMVRDCLKSGSTDLQHSGLVEFVNDEGVADTEALTLSDGVMATFFEGVEIAQPEKETHGDLVSAASITAKELFYNESESEQIGRLAGLLDEANYRGIRARLAETGMRRGFGILFYGAPGTGKTASAFELARQTGRDIFVVDMSKLRSKWVGDSEKNVKGLFNIYRRLCRKNERAPILLFNEADAIFMKRFENVEASVDQMNNTLQNIILQEMENLDGILIATTNLVGNLDPAFERRFLYKVEFHKPGVAARAKIWKSMIKSLSDADAETLAVRYDFAGGNIENVARKSSVEYVLSGRKPSVESLSTFCEEETYAKTERKRIGF